MYVRSTGAQQGPSDWTLLDTPRAEVGIPQGGWPSVHKHTYHSRCDSLQTAESYLEIKSISRFGRIQSPFGAHEVRDRPPFVAISSDRSDPRRFRSAWDMIYRFKHSLVASDDISAISRDLARFEPHLASLAPSRCASEHLRWHERPLLRDKAAYIKKI